MIDLSKARKHIEKLYLDTCSVYEFQEVTDPETHMTTHELVLVYENVPCKISHHVPQATGDGLVGSLSLSSRLICSPDLVIKAGSRIDVMRKGVTTSYSNSGEPARYFNHQEIMIDLLDGEA